MPTTLPGKSATVMSEHGCRDQEHHDPQCARTPHDQGAPETSRACFQCRPISISHRRGVEARIDIAPTCSGADAALASLSAEYSMPKMRAVALSLPSQPRSL